MTMILCFVCPQFTIQVSDRRVTVGGKTHDSIANKAIIYGSDDCLITVGYTGLAYIGDKPTDEKIAEWIRGQEFPRGPDGIRPAAMNLGWMSANSHHLATVVRRIQVGLRDSWKTLSASARKIPLQMGVAGWYWRREAWRQYLVILEWRPDIERLSFDGGWRQFLSAQNLGIWASSGLHDTDFEELRSKLRSCPPGFPLYKHVEQTFIDTIREISKSHPTIGPDLMSVVVPPPHAHPVMVEFHSATVSTLTVSTMSGNLSVDVSFTPWILGPQIAMAPCKIGGGWSTNIGTHAVQILGSEPRSPVIGLLSSQERTPRPKRADS